MGGTEVDDVNSQGYRGIGVGKTEDAEDKTTLEPYARMVYRMIQNGDTYGGKYYKIGVCG